MPDKLPPTSYARPCKGCHHRFADHRKVDVGLDNGSPGIDHSCTICTCTQFED